MGTSVSAVSNVSSSNRRGLSYDAGEELKSAIDSIKSDQSNDNIENLAGRISSNLQNAGVRNTKWVKEMLYQYRGAQYGVGGDASRFKSNVALAQRLGVLGPRGAQSLLGKLNEAVASRQDTFEPSGVTQSEAPKSNPVLEKVSQGLDALSRNLPEGSGLKAGVDAVKSCIDVMRANPKDSSAYIKAAADLADATFQALGQVVKTFGSDPKLAMEAFHQLNKIASVVAKGSRVFDAINSGSKALLGYSVTGAKCTKEERADAAIDFVCAVAPGPVSAATRISVEGLKWIYNNIGVPAHRAIEEIGLRNLFGGKTPGQLEDEIRKMPINPNTARWALDKLFYKTFGNQTSGFSQASCSDLWKRYIASTMQDNNQEMTLLNTNARTKPGENPVIDDLRVTMAERYRSAALRFIAMQRAEARGNW